MDKKEALNCFYAKNHINISLASDTDDGNYDKRIASLSKQVDIWLSYIDKEDHSLFLSLLSKYTYLTPAQCQIRYGKILSMVKEKAEQCGYDFSQVLFVTVESSSSYMSGSDNVRADLRKRNLGTLNKRQVVAAHSNLKTEDVEPYKIIVFLDDTVGSGKTIWGEIEHFCKQFSLSGNDNEHHLFYACIAPRRHGIKHIRDNCRMKHIRAEALFDEAWYEEPAFNMNSPDYLRLEKYEQIVGNYLMAPHESFFMGFEKNRMLLSFHYNTPNNTLSTFWRFVPGINDPPFYRDGNQPPKRPTIEGLKTEKKALTSSAYAYGRDFRRKMKNE